MIPHCTPRALATAIAVPTLYPVAWPEADCLMACRLFNSAHTAGSSGGKSTPLAHEEVRWHTLIKDRIVWNTQVKERAEKSQAAFAMV